MVDDTIGPPIGGAYVNILDADGSLWCSIRFIEYVLLACSENESYLSPRPMSRLELDGNTTHISFSDHVAYLFNSKTDLSCRPFTEDYRHPFE